MAAADDDVDKNVDKVMNEKSDGGRDNNGLMSSKESLTTITTTTTTTSDLNETTNNDKQQQQRNSRRPPSIIETALSNGIGLSSNISGSSTVIKRTVITLDVILDRLRCPGFAQMFIYCLLCLNVFPVSLNFMAMSLFGASPNQTCRIPDEWDNTSAIPLGENGKLEKCLMYRDPNNKSLGTDSCIFGYEYHLSDGRYPITAEWDLVCDQTVLVRIAQSVFFAGVMVGGLMFGYFGDEYGRRPVLLTTLYAQALLGVACALSNSYVMFVILKFFQGMMLQGLQTSNNTMAMELFQTRYRTIAGMIIAILATFCSIVIGVIFFLVPHWRYMQLVISVPTILTLTFLWLLPESLRWLVSHNKLDEAMKVLRMYGRRNKVEVPSDTHDNIQTLSQQILATTTSQSVKTNMLDLMKIRTVRRTSIILFYCWFTASIVYYGITFSIPDLSGNTSLNFIIVGSLESISRIIGYFIIKQFGRRIPLSISFILSGILCIVSASIGIYLKGKDHNLGLLVTALALLGRACMGQCFAFILIVTSEVFPTVLRTAGSGACSTWTRIGGTIAPYTLLMDKYVGKATPFVVFGLLAIVAGFLTILIPETLNVPLPDTVQDTQQFHSSQQPHHQTVVRNGTDTLDKNEEEEEEENEKNEKFSEIQNVPHDGVNVAFTNEDESSVTKDHSTKL